MKKLMGFLIITLFPIFIFAKELENTNLNIKLEVNDDYITLTRDNLLDNKDLDKLGLTKENMEKLMIENNIYFDIIKSDISYEVLVVVPKTNVSIKNLTKEDDLFLENLRKELAKQTDSEISNIYKNNYNFVMVDYYDKNTGYYIVNYYTIVNSRGYNFQLQKKTQLTDSDKDDLKNIIDNVTFKIIEEKKEEKKEEKQEFDYMIIVYGAILGAMAGIITYYIGITYKRIKSSK